MRLGFGGVVETTSGIAVLSSGALVWLVATAPPRFASEAWVVVTLLARGTLAHAVQSLALAALAVASLLLLLPRGVTAFGAPGAGAVESAIAMAIVAAGCALHIVVLVTALAAPATMSSHTLGTFLGLQLLVATALLAVGAWLELKSCPAPTASRVWAGRVVLTASALLHGSIVPAALLCGGGSSSAPTLLAYSVVAGGAGLSAAALVACVPPSAAYESGGSSPRRRARLSISVDDTTLSMPPPKDPSPLSVGMYRPNAPLTVSPRLRTRSAATSPTSFALDAASARRFFPLPEAFAANV